MTRDEAATIAARHSPKGLTVHVERGRELATGWYFPWRMATGARLIGSAGVVVNKSTRRLFHLGSAPPIERQLALYDAGYQFERYDLTIERIDDRERVLDVLHALGPTIVEPTVEHGVEWRIPRRLERTELARTIDSLPCMFANVALNDRAEILEQARAAQVLVYRVCEHEGS